MNGLRPTALFALLLAAMTAAGNCAAPAPASTSGNSDQQNTSALEKSPACKLSEGPKDEDHWHILLDGKAATLSQRRALFAAFEQCAQDGNIEEQSVAGSLYYMGDDLPDALVAHDSDKARIYFSNAAAHGKIIDMAKMSELELAAQNYVAAMVWAQLYGHYDTQVPSENRPSDGYLAELIQRIQSHLAPKDEGTVANDVNAFAAKFDSTVRTQVKKYSLPNDMKWVNRNLQLVFDVVRPIPTANAGFADYLVAFRPNGSVANVWLIDALPDAGMGKMLRLTAKKIRVTPSSGTQLRYAAIRVIFDDQHYELQKPNQLQH